MQASLENTNVKPLISASNSLATSIDINCEANIPTKIPTINDNIPTRMVSNKIMLEICLLPIPSVIYIPNSLFRLFIRKLLAYTIRKPSIIAINTEIIPSNSIISLIISLVDWDTWSIACWLSKELNI